MARIPFPTGLEGSEKLPRTRRLLQNCFNNGKGSVLSRPGILGLNTTGKVARGSFVWNKDLYQVVSQDLIKITDTTTGAFDIIGLIEGTAVIEHSIGFNFAVIIVKGGDGYTLSKGTPTFDVDIVGDNGGIAEFIHSETGDNVPVVGNTVTLSGFILEPSYNATGVVTVASATTFEIGSIPFVGVVAGQGSFAITLVKITDLNFKPSVDVANINGRTVYIPADGSPAFFSDVGAPRSIQALSFFDAEELPDENNGVFNFRNTLYIMGTDSIELFRDTGASPNPFQRINGSRIINGFIGGLLEYNNTFLFIGREKDQDFGIYALGQGIAPKISNETIDLLLSTYTQDELAEAIPGRLKWRGYDIATFQLRRDSFAFLNGNWFKLDTVFDGVSRPWGGGFITQFEGEYFTAFEGQIGKFTTINSDYGNRITRIIDTSISEGNTDFFSCQSLELGISQGFNDVPIAVPVEVSINSVTDFSELAQFNFTAVPGLTLVIGQFIEIKGFQDNLAYNMSGPISATNGTTNLIIFSIPFGTDEIGGSFNTPSFTEIKTNVSGGSVALQMSNDNVDYGPRVYRNLGLIGNYDKKLMWNLPGGLGTYKGFMGIRFFTTENVDFSDDYIVAKIRGPRG